MLLVEGVDAEIGADKGNTAIPLDGTVGEFNGGNFSKTVRTAAPGIESEAASY